MPPLLPGVLGLGAAGGYAKPLYAIASGRSRAGAGGGANLYGSDMNVRSANRVMWETFACSGATTANVLPKSLGGVPQGAAGRYDGKTQIDSASLASANLVTLTLGGNDAGYVDVLITCGLDNCNTRAFERSRAAIIDPAEAPSREGLPRDRRQGAARTHPRPRLPPPVPSREGTAGLSRVEPVPGGAGHVAAARDAPQRHDRVGSCHGRPLGCANHVRPRGGQVRGPRGLWQQGRVDQRDRHELDRASGSTPPRSIRRSAGSATATGLRSTPPSGTDRAVAGYQRSRSSRACASMSATIDAAGRTASSIPIDCPA